MARAHRLPVRALLLGFTCSGLLGVGGGFVIVPGLQRLSNVPIASVVGTSLAVVALVSLWGVATTALEGHLDTALALPFATGALAGMIAGRVGARRVPSTWLQQGFALLVAFVAAGMTLKALAT